MAGFATPHTCSSLDLACMMSFPVVPLHVLTSSISPCFLVSVLLPLLPPSLVLPPPFLPSPPRLLASGHSTLQALRMVKAWRGVHVVVPREDLLKRHREQGKKGQRIIIGSCWRRRRCWGWWWWWCFVAWQDEETLAPPPLLSLLFLRMQHCMCVCVCVVICFQGTAS